MAYIFNTLLSVNPHHLSAFNLDTEHEYANHAKLKVVTGNIPMRCFSSGAEAAACLSECTHQPCVHSTNIKTPISPESADRLRTFKDVALLYHCHALILAPPLRRLMLGPQTRRLTKDD